MAHIRSNYNRFMDDPAESLSVAWRQADCLLSDSPTSGRPPSVNGSQLYSKIDPKMRAMVLLSPLDCPKSPPCLVAINDTHPVVHRRGLSLATFSPNRAFFVSL